MAKSKSGLLGPFYGKIGPVIGSHWKGINYIKSVSAKQPKQPTAAQLANQAKFKFMNQWLEPFHPYITVSFFGQHRNRTEINHAFQLNYRVALQGFYPNFSIDYSKVCLSKGLLKAPQLQQLDAFMPGSLSFSWVQQTGRWAAHDDQLMLVLFAPELRLADGGVGMAKRSDGKLIYAYDSRLGAQEVEIYVSFIALNRKKMSDSIYLGRMLLP